MKDNRSALVLLCSYYSTRVNRGDNKKTHLIPVEATGIVTGILPGMHSSSFWLLSGIRLNDYRLPSTYLPGMIFLYTYISHLHSLIADECQNKSTSSTFWPKLFLTEEEASQPTYNTRYRCDAIDLRVTIHNYSLHPCPMGLFAVWPFRFFSKSVFWVRNTQSSSTNWRAAEKHAAESRT